MHAYLKSYLWRILLNSDPFFVWYRLPLKRYKLIRCITTVEGFFASILLFICSTFSRKFNATETFSSFCERNCGFLLYFGSFLCDNTSINDIKFNPSLKSYCKSSIRLLTSFKCSFAHLVNVFCWTPLRYWNCDRMPSVKIAQFMQKWPNRWPKVAQFVQKWPKVLTRGCYSKSHF